MGGAQFTADDKINGGGGRDELFLDGNYSSGLVFKATSLINIQTIIARAAASTTA